MRDDNVTVSRDTPVGMWPVWAVLALSVGSGVVVFIGAALLALAFQLTIRIAAAAAGVAVLAVWFLWVARIDRIFWARERVRPAAVPTFQQTGPTPVVQVEVSDVARQRWAFMDLPGDDLQLQHLARGLAAGRTLSEGEWSGRGRLYTRREFRALRGEFLERGLAVWRNRDAPAQGVELTAVGRQVMSRIAEDGARSRAHVGPASRIALPDPEQ